MSHGLEMTLKVLADTANEAAVGVLITALDSEQKTIRDGALDALLKRRSSTGQQELLRRWKQLEQSWKEVIRERPGRIAGAIRDAVLGSDEAMCANGCEAVLWIREYDLIPALITAAEDKTNRHADQSLRTILALTESLYDELAGPRDYRVRRDPQLVRQHVVASLEQSVQRFEQHRRRGIIEGFLLLTNRDNAALKKILHDPHDGAFLTIIDVLTNSQRPGIVRLVLSYLDDAHAPSSSLNVIAHRRDLPFLRHLLKKIGFEPSAAAKSNLRRMSTIAWLRDDLELLHRLDEAEQHAVVQLVTASGMNRLEVAEVVQYILAQGNPGGRRAASVAVAEFKGSKANELVLQSLRDSDPQVQANLLVQLRERGIPGAMTRLLEFVESSHAQVRQAAQRCLSEFSFQRYLAAFDMLEPDVRKSTGAIVRKVDPQAVSSLVAELTSASRTRRLRGLEVAVAIGAVADVEQLVIELLADEDHFIRTEAARALAYCDTPTSRGALREALLDRSVTVQEAAEASLQALAAGGVVAPDLATPENGLADDNPLLTP